MKVFISICMLVMVVACGAGSTETKARIIERKMLDDNRLLIKYSFVAGNRIINDSVAIKNKVIPHDSVRVNYSPSHPEKNRVNFE